MSLLQYKPQFDNAYEEVFNKVLVAKSIANMRFEPTLSYGASVTRVIYDASNVRVRTTTRGSASTIDTLSDSTEALTINLEKEAVFHISDGEVKQAGPLNPGEVIGGQIAIKVATDLDARVLAEVRNALYAFDNGDLTTGSSTGTPITLSSTTVPQMVTRMPAKLKAQNQVLTNVALVLDPYAIADLEQYLLGKNFDIVNAVFANGYAGAISMAEVYVSNNLTGSVVFTSATTPTDGDTVVINGVTFTFRTTLGSTAGSVLISGSADAARANLTALINDPATTTTYGVALSDADQITIADTLKLTATNSNSADTMTLVGVGSGRLVPGGTMTATTNTWSLNMIHAYYGKKGAIDLVVQDLKSVDMRETADRRGTNVFSSYLAGLKTFADGAKKFLNVKIAC